MIGKWGYALWEIFPLISKNDRNGSYVIESSKFTNESGVNDMHAHSYTCIYICYIYMYVHGFPIHCTTCLSMYIHVYVYIQIIHTLNMHYVPVV